MFWVWILNRVSVTGFNVFLHFRTAMTHLCLIIIHETACSYPIRRCFTYPWQRVLISYDRHFKLKITYSSRDTLMDQKRVKTIILWNIIRILRDCVLLFRVYLFLKCNLVILICWFAAQETFLIFINVETRFCSHSKY